MGFAIQTSQNREAKANASQLDELIHGTRGASNTLMDEEHETEARIHADEARRRRPERTGSKCVERLARRHAANLSLDSHRNIWFL